ncbi:MAG: hypothetical protein ACTSVT_01340 [Candidatus Thorarchaeota archaeon]
MANMNCNSLRSFDGLNPIPSWSLTVILLHMAIGEKATWFPRSFSFAVDSRGSDMFDRRSAQASLYHPVAHFNPAL